MLQVDTSIALLPQTALRLPSSLFVHEQHCENDSSEGEEDQIPPPRRYSTQEQVDLDEKIRKFQRSSMSRRSSALQSPLLEEVIARITQSFSSRSEIVSTPPCKLDMKPVVNLSRDTHEAF